MFVGDTCRTTKKDRQADQWPLASRSVEHSSSPWSSFVSYCCTTESTRHLRLLLPRTNFRGTLATTIQQLLRQSRVYEDEDARVPELPIGTYASLANIILRRPAPVLEAGQGTVDVWNYKGECNKGSLFLIALSVLFEHLTRHVRVPQFKASLTIGCETASFWPKIETG
jgi:hypothetical protein